MNAEKKLLCYSTEDLLALRDKDSSKCLPSNLSKEFLVSLHLYRDPNAKEKKSRYRDPNDKVKKYSRSQLKAIGESVSSTQLPDNLSLDHLKTLNISKESRRRLTPDQDVLFMPEWKENGFHRRRENSWRSDRPAHHRSSYHESMTTHDDFGRYRTSSEQFDDDPGLQMGPRQQNGYQRGFFDRSERDHNWRNRRPYDRRRVEETPEWFIGDTGVPGVASNEYFDRALPGDEHKVFTDDDDPVNDHSEPDANGVPAAVKRDRKSASTSSWDEQFYADIDNLLKQDPPEESRFQKFFQNESRADKVDVGANVDDLKVDDEAAGGKIITVSELEKGLPKQSDTGSTAAFQNFLRMMDSKEASDAAATSAIQHPPYPFGVNQQHSFVPPAALVGTQHMSAPNLNSSQLMFQIPIAHSSRVTRPDTLAFLPTAVKRNLAGEGEGGVHEEAHSAQMAHLYQMPIIPPPSRQMPVEASSIVNASSSPQLNVRKPILPSPVHANLMSTQMLLNQPRLTTAHREQAMRQQQMIIFQQQQLAMAKAKQLAMHQMRQRQDGLAGLFSAPIGNPPAGNSKAKTLDEVEGKG